MANSYDLQEWRNERGRILKAQEEVLSAARSEERLPTAEENQKYDELEARYNELGQAIQRHEKLEAEKASIIEQTEAIKHERKEVDPKLAFRKFLRFGYSALDAEERKAAFVEKRGTNDQVTTTDSLGGYTVPEFWFDEIVKYMAQYSGMLEAGNIIRTASGGTLNFPYVNETAVTGALITEGTADTVSDITFANIQLDAYTYTSKVVKVSYELLNDSAYNLDAFIQGLLAERLGRAINTALTTGDGSSKPNGIATAASAGKTAAATNAITRDEIVDLIHSVDRAYRSGPNVAFMLHDSTLAAIKKLTVGSADDRPLWQPSIESGTPGLLEGYPIVVNNDVAELTDGASSEVAFFGDWSKYYIRMVNDFELRRLVERYADERCVGFFGFMRVDGDLIDTTAIKSLTLAAS